MAAIEERFFVAYGAPLNDGQRRLGDGDRWTIDVLSRGDFWWMRSLATLRMTSNAIGARL